MDDDLKAFEEITKDVKVSPKLLREARKLSANRTPTQPNGRPPVPVGASPWRRVVMWAENRAHTQGRAWAR